MENGGCVATQDSVPLIGLADRSTRSLEDKDPEEGSCVPGPEDRPRRALSNDLLRCVNLVTCRSRPLEEQSPT